MDQDITIAELPAELSPKRRQILAAAEDLFLAQGYGAVSMENVAKRANVSKATLYAHFTSKAQLFATIVDERKLDIPLGPELFPADIADLAQLRTALERIGNTLLNFMLRERTLAIYRIALAEAGRFPEIGLAFYQNGPCRMLDLFGEWLAVLEARGLVVVENRRIACEQFTALMRSGVFLRRSLAVPPEPDAAEILISVKAAANTWLAAFAA